MVLLNSILSNIPIFLFSFYKAPKVVLKEKIKLQKYFLWGECEESKKVYWVSWDSICLAKEDDCLGVRHCGLFNIDLLSKWKWRVLNDVSPLWSEIISFRYNNVKLAVLGGPCRSRKTSL